MSDLRADLAPIGVLGGTFDPIHTGHLRLAIEVREALQLDSVRLIPLDTPNHREPPRATSAQRLEMVQAVAAGRHHFVDHVHAGCPVVSADPCRASNVIISLATMGAAFWF